MIIYKHTSKTSGKSYIGMTNQSITRRWQQHCTNSRTRNKNNHFYNAIKKYGENDFTHDVLVSNIDTYIELKSIEQYFISFYDTFNGGYNSTRGGDLYNEKDDLMFECNGNFKKTCEENDLPYHSLMSSYKSGEDLYNSKVKFSKTRNEFKKYKGWYATYDKQN